MWRSQNRTVWKQTFEIACNCIMNVRIPFTNSPHIIIILLDFGNSPPKICPSLMLIHHWPPLTIISHLHALERTRLSGKPHILSESGRISNFPGQFFLDIFFHRLHDWKEFHRFPSWSVITLFKTICQQQVTSIDMSIFIYMQMLSNPWFIVRRT